MALRVSMSFNWTAPGAEQSGASRDVAESVLRLSHLTQQSKPVVHALARSRTEVSDNMSSAGVVDVGASKESRNATTRSRGPPKGRSILMLSFFHQEAGPLPKCASDEISCKHGTATETST